AGGFWMWIGVLSLLSGPVFGTLSDKLGRKVGFMLVFACQGTAYTLAAMGGGTWVLYLSVGLFGVAAWSIPSIMAAAVGDFVGAKRTPQAFGTVTFIFALGQITGPAIAGELAEYTGSFSSSFLMAAAMAGVAIALSATLKKPESAE
ncbi:MFS transporter, partial [Nitrospirota bacterium]